MNFSVREVAAWLELTRIARMEIMLDKIEHILIGLELERSDGMFMYWEELTEKNGEALASWWENYHSGVDLDDWLSEGVTLPIGPS